MAVTTALALGLVASLLPSSLAGEHEEVQCAENALPEVSLLQHGYALWSDLREGGADHSAHVKVTEAVRHIPVAAESIDMNGRPCSYCGPPSADRIDREYAVRTDCGNKSREATKDIPFVNISEPGTSAACELNYQKACSDAVYNKDYVYFGKSIDLSSAEAKVDGHFCLQYGFLEPSLVAIADNFTALHMKGVELCRTKFAKYRWDTITFSQFEAVAHTASQRGYPTRWEAEFVAAAKCALFDMHLGCEIAFCAYTFCKNGDGTVSAYNECPGFTQLHGNLQ